MYEKIKFIKKLNVLKIKCMKKNNLCGKKNI